MTKAGTTINSQTHGLVALSPSFSPVVATFSQLHPLHIKQLPSDIPNFRHCLQVTDTRLRREMGERQTCWSTTSSKVLLSYQCSFQHILGPSLLPLSWVKRSKIFQSCQKAEKHSHMCIRKWLVSFLFLISSSLAQPIQTLQ